MLDPADTEDERAGLGSRFVAALEAVLARGIRHEIRTAYLPTLRERADLTELARGLAGRGMRNRAIQEFSRWESSTRRSARLRFLGHCSPSFARSYPG